MQLPNWLKLIRGDMGGDDDGDVVMMLHEPIGDVDPWTGEGVTSKSFGLALNSVGKNKKITLEINCLGGSVPDGMAMYNMLRTRNNVTTRVVGYAASMGAIIHQAGAVRQMMPGTMMIIHNPETDPGPSDHRDLQHAADVTKQVKDSIVDLLASRTGQGKRAISDMMDKVTCMDSKEAKDLGFCDAVIDGAPVWNDFNPVRFFNKVRRFSTPQDALGGQPAAVNQPNKKSMKLILTALAGLLTLPADATDEAAAPQVKNAVDSLVKERDQLKASVESFTTAMKTRVTNRVDAAIAAKKVKPERKDALIALGLTNETNLDFLDDLAAPTTGQPARRGAAPLPNDQPTDLDTINAKIKELRNSLDDASPAEQSTIAKKLRELRGHKELFASAAK